MFCGWWRKLVIYCWQHPFSLLLFFFSPALCFCRSSHLRRICRKVKIPSRFSKIFTLYCLRNCKKPLFTISENEGTVLLSLSNCVPAKKKKIVRYQNCQGISFVSILRALKKLYLESRGRLIWIGEALHLKIVGKACFSQYYIFFTKYLSTYFGLGQGRNIYCWLPATCARHCTGSCLSFF